MPQGASRVAEHRVHMGNSVYLSCFAWFLEFSRRGIPLFWWLWMTTEHREEKASSHFPTTRFRTIGKGKQFLDHRQAFHVVPAGACSWSESFQTRDEVSRRLTNVNAVHGFPGDWETTRVSSRVNGIWDKPAVFTRKTSR